MATPRAPACETKPIEPRRAAVGEKVALSDTSGSVLITPMQLGPTMRRPPLRTNSHSSRSSAAPSSPVSAKPAVITTRPPTPFSTHSATTPITASRGTATTARSTASGTARIDGYAFSEWIAPAFGLTGKMAPANCACTRLWSSAKPSESRLREAPTTATERGAKIGSSVRGARWRDAGVPVSDEEVPDVLAPEVLVRDVLAPEVLAGEAVAVSSLMARSAYRAALRHGSLNRPAAPAPAGGGATAR